MGRLLLSFPGFPFGSFFAGAAGGPALFHASIIRVLGLSARHYKELMMRYQQFVMLQSG
jgi:hypothetical protein